MNEIVSYLDYTKECYLELFDSSLIFFKDTKHNIEVYNDINDEIYNLSYCLQFKREETEYIVNNNIITGIRDKDISRAINTLLKYSVLFKYNSLIYTLDRIYDRMRVVTILNTGIDSVMMSVMNKDYVNVYIDIAYDLKRSEFDLIMDFLNNTMCSVLVRTTTELSCDLDGVRVGNHFVYSNYALSRYGLLI